MLSLSEISAQFNKLLKANIQSEGIFNLFDSKQRGEKLSLFGPAAPEEMLYLAKILTEQTQEEHVLILAENVSTLHPIRICRK